MIKFCLNDLVLLVLNALCDVFLIFKFNSILKKKSKLSKKLKELENTKTRVKIFICINCFMLLILRSIEFGFSVYVFYQMLYTLVCFSENKICSNYLEFGNMAYLLSTTYTILVFSFLNKNFRTVLFILIQKIKSYFIYV